MLKIYYGHIQLLKDPDMFQNWFGKMDNVRKEKILCCKKEADKRRSLLAGVLLKLGLEKDRHAKQLYYSISHSGDYVVCVLSDRKVGVDIENKFRSIFSKEKRVYLERIANKCLTMGEEIRFYNSEEKEKVDKMLLFWTRKESYSKAIGKGLAMDFKIIDTEKMDELFWSGWLKEGYFCSLYVEDGRLGDMKLQEIQTL